MGCDGSLRLVGIGWVRGRGGGEAHLGCRLTGYCPAGMGRSVLGKFEFLAPLRLFGQTCDWIGVWEGGTGSTRGEQTAESLTELPGGTVLG